MNARLKLAGLLSAAALAVPGAAAVSAVASDGGSSETVTTQRQPGLSPVQEGQPGRPGDDCPDKQGGNGSQSGSDSAAGSSAGATQL